MVIPAVVEGHMESVFLPVVLNQIGRADLQLTIRDARGGTKFWPIAARYNEAGRYTPVIGLADLEQAECASSLLGSKLPSTTIQVARFSSSSGCADAGELAAC